MPLPGDIVFVKTGKKKNLSIVGQSVLRATKASYSHVAIVLDPGSLIHSMPGKGVITVGLKTELKSSGKGNITVLRHCDLEKDENKRMELREKLSFYRKQRYNYALSLRRNETSSYCSELAAKAYSDIGIPLVQNAVRNTLPIDLEVLFNDKLWKDVTDEYEVDTDYKSVIDFSPELAEWLENSDAIIQKTSEAQRIAEDHLQQSSKEQARMLALINRLNELTGQEKLDIELPNKYWDTKK